MGETPHLVHGMGKAMEAPAWPAITADEAAVILSRFPTAGRVTALRWHAPRPFSAASLVETDRGHVFLKRHHRSVRTPGALAAEHDFMAHLRAAGLPVPEVVTAADGTGAVARGDWTYELHRAGRGLDLYRDRPSWTPFLSHAHAHEAGVALARLHRAAAGFAAPPRGPYPLIASFTILPSPDPLAAAETYIGARPALADFLGDRPWRAQLGRLFASSGADLSARLRDQPLLWTHGDWHPSNLLWSPDGKVSGIFDFGLAAPTCALHDLATAIERTALPWLDLAEGKIDAPVDAEAALALLAGYQTTTPLSRSDIETLVRLLPLVHVEFALSEIDYFAGCLGDPSQASLAWDSFLIGHAAWFSSEPGREFLRYVESGAVA